MICFTAAMREYGVRAFPVKELLPVMVKLLSDPQPDVRNATMDAMEEVYKYEFFYDPCDLSLYLQY